MTEEVFLQKLLLLLVENNCVVKTYVDHVIRSVRSDREGNITLPGLSTFKLETLVRDNKFFFFHFAENELIAIVSQLLPLCKTLK